MFGMFQRSFRRPVEVAAHGTGETVRIDAGRYACKEPFHVASKKRRRDLVHFLFREKKPGHTRGRRMARMPKRMAEWAKHH